MPGFSIGSRAGPVMPYFFSFGSSSLYWVETIGFAQISNGSSGTCPGLDGMEIRTVCFVLGVGGSGPCPEGMEIRIH